MKSKWQIHNISEVCEIKYGKALKSENRINGKYPVYGSNGIVGYHNEALVNFESILIGRKGSIGELHYSKTPFWPIDTTYYLAFDKSKIYPLWFYYILKKLNLKYLNRSAAIPGLNRDDVYRLNILVPPLDEQKRIAAVLSRAEKLIARRKESIKALDEFLKSTFLEMFGESNTNFNEWPIVEIKDLVAEHKGSMRTGPFGSNLLHSEFTESGDVAVLGIDNAVKNMFKWDEKRYITMEKYSKLSAYRIYPGDVIITIMGTIGRTAVIPDDIPLAINTKHLAAITLNKNKANPKFIAYSMHSNPYIIKQFANKTRGAIMNGLNLGLIKETKLRKPPIELQNKFAAIVQKIEMLKARYAANLAELENLYGTLSQRAFKGELDLSRVGEMAGV